jgi:hypothetical protein
MTWEERHDRHRVRKGRRVMEGGEEKETSVVVYLTTGSDGDRESHHSKPHPPSLLTLPYHIPPSLCRLSVKSQRRPRFPRVRKVNTPLCQRVCTLALGGISYLTIYQYWCTDGFGFLLYLLKCFFVKWDTPLSFYSLLLLLESPLSLGCQ